VKKQMTLIFLFLNSLGVVAWADQPDCDKIQSICGESGYTRGIPDEQKSAKPNGGKHHRGM
jgi:hypothetical protein